MLILRAISKNYWEGKMNTITRWNPARQMVGLREAMDRLFEDSVVRGWSEQDSGALVYRLPIDAYSTDNEIIVKAAVPGVKPEAVEITVEGDTLTIRGEVPEEPENVHTLLAERFHGRFARTLQLNIPVDADKIEATFESGVLTLTLPKAEEARPRVIKVQAK